ncbi:hypothetical protein CRG98_029759 [Punica granatum]|uniref:Uncharacterized protein n=1 Tax=Punica granatum TaxID=22663 RepID=A0A2I0J0S2_PUNGR|nr:hypothetical protein CRG98_029759 [Punica granatum]
MNHTTHLDLPNSALEVSDVLFKSLEIRSRQIDITVTSGTPKQLRKQSKKSSFNLLGCLRLHICITGIRVNNPRCQTIYVKMTDVRYRYEICCGFLHFGRRTCSRVNSAPVTSPCAQTLDVTNSCATVHVLVNESAAARLSARSPARTPVCPCAPTSLRLHACTHAPGTSVTSRASTGAYPCARLPSCARSRARPRLSTLQRLSVPVHIHPRTKAHPNVLPLNPELFSESSTESPDS